MKARMDRLDTFLTSLTMYIKPQELLTAIFHASRGMPRRIPGCIYIIFSMSQVRFKGVAE